MTPPYRHRQPWTPHIRRIVSSLAESVHDSSTAAVPERRQLTVMFCDLVGSTAMAQRLDPEDLRALILRFQQLVRDLVARYEGFVARYMGDGVLVYFGYPVAHEDDAARAIHAGLGIVRAAQLLDPPLDPSGRPGRCASACDWRGRGRRSHWCGRCRGSGGRRRSAKPRVAAAVVGRTPDGAGRRSNTATRRVTLRVRIAARAHAERLPATGACLDRVASQSERSRFDQTHPAALTPWVGRSDELSRLLDLWREATRGPGSSCSSPARPASASRASCKSWATGSGLAVLSHLLSVLAVPRQQCVHPFVHQLEKAAGFVPGEATDQPPRQAAPAARRCFAGARQRHAAFCRTALPADRRAAAILVTRTAPPRNDGGHPRPPARAGFAAAGIAGARRCTLG